MVDLKALRIWYMWPLYVAMGEGICLVIRLIFMFVHVEKYPLFMAWRKVCFNGLNSVTWYHVYISILVLSGINFKTNRIAGVGGGCDMEARFTCHIPDCPLQSPSNNVDTWLSTLRQVDVIVDVHT